MVDITPFKKDYGYTHLCCNLPLWIIEIKKDVPRVCLDITTQRWVIVAIIIVVKSRFIVEVLSREADIISDATDNKGRLTKGSILSLPYYLLIGVNYGLWFT